MDGLGKIKEDLGNDRYSIPATIDQNHRIDQSFSESRTQQQLSSSSGLRHITMLRIEDTKCDIASFVAQTPRSGLTFSSRLYLWISFVYPTRWGRISLIP